MKEFFLRQLSAVNAFNYEVDLPISDGIVVYYKADGKNIDLATVYLPMYSPCCEIKVDKNIILSEHIKDYDEFLALDAAVEKAKYHINLAHEAALTAAYIGD